MIDETRNNRPLRANSSPVINDQQISLIPPYVPPFLLFPLVLVVPPLYHLLPQGHQGLGQSPFSPQFTSGIRITLYDSLYIYCRCTMNFYHRNNCYKDV